MIYDDIDPLPEEFDPQVHWDVPWNHIDEMIPIWLEEGRKRGAKFIVVVGDGGMAGPSYVYHNNPATADDQLSGGGHVLRSIHVSSGIVAEDSYELEDKLEDLMVSEEEYPYGHPDRCEVRIKGTDSWGCHKKRGHSSEAGGRHCSTHADCGKKLEDGSICSLEPGHDAGVHE